MSNPDNKGAGKDVDCDGNLHASGKCTNWILSLGSAHLVDMLRVSRKSCHYITCTTYVILLYPLKDLVVSSDQKATMNRMPGWICQLPCVR